MGSFAEADVGTTVGKAKAVTALLEGWISIGPSVGSGTPAADGIKTENPGDSSNIASAQ